MHMYKFQYHPMVTCSVSMREETESEDKLEKMVG